MGKGSKAETVREIRRKQALQAEFQLGVSATNSTVMSWLGEAGADGGEASEFAPSFLALPVVDGGLGLDLSKQGGTIGDFLRMDSMAGREKKGTLVERNTSQALKALHNRMRDDQRRQARQGVHKPAHRPQSAVRELVDRSRGKHRSGGAAAAPAAAVAAAAASTAHDSDDDTGSRLLTRKQPSHFKGKPRPF